MPAPIILDPHRLSALEATGLLDSPAEKEFDRLTGLVQKLLAVPVSLVSLVDKDRQFFKSGAGLPEPWATLRQTPLSHSFCQHVVAIEAPLVVSDARDHSMVCDNLAIRDLDVIAYLGVPLVTPEGFVIGSLCAIESTPRDWGEKDVDVLTELAELVMTEIGLRHQLDARMKAEALLAEHAASLERSNRDLQEFAHVASHDLKEPLRKIRVYADRLLTGYEDQIDDRGKQYLSRMASAVNRMQQFIDDLLRMSRVTSGACPPERLDLYAIARSVRDDLSQRIDESGGRVHLGELGHIEADPLQIRQVLQNLISNALKFSREGVPPEVRVYGQQAVEQDGEVYRIVVADNGIGFDPSQLDKILRPFQRLNGRSAFEGSGIGLSICEKIVDRHGGSISVESAPGEGATFYVALPVHRS